MIVHEWLERKARWPVFLGVIGFFGGFLYFASGWAAAAVMVGVILYPISMACFNRTEIWREEDRLRWRYVPVYCKKSGDVRLEEITHVFYGESVRKKNTSDAPLRGWHCAPQWEAEQAFERLPERRRSPQLCGAHLQPGG